MVGLSYVRIFHAGVITLHTLPQVLDCRMNLWSLLLLLPVMFALVYDLRTREIPDWIPLVIVAWACLATAAGLCDVTWMNLTAGALLGLGLGAAAFYLGRRSAAAMRNCWRPLAPLWVPGLSCRFWPGWPSLAGSWPSLRSPVESETLPMCRRSPWVLW